jgi:hypothetical protein
VSAPGRHVTLRLGELAVPTPEDVGQPETL